MIACSSPRGTSSEIPSDATMPPNRLVRPSTCSSGSAMAGLQLVYVRRAGDGMEQPVDAAPREQHDEQQQRTEDDLPIFGDAGQHLLEDEQRHRTDERAER